MCLQLRDMMLRTRPFPIRVTDDEFDRMLEKFKAGVIKKGVDHHFRARSFHEFWRELTDEDLKQTANVNTWEEEIDKRMAEAKERILKNKSQKAFAANPETIEH